MTWAPSTTLPPTRAENDGNPPADVNSIVSWLGELLSELGTGTLKGSYSSLSNRLANIGGMGTTINATAAPYNLVAGSTAAAAANTTGLQAAVDAADALGGGTVFIPAGLYWFNLVTHPATGGLGFGKCVVAVRANVRITGEPTSPSLTELKLVGGASLSNDTQNRFVINWNANGVSTDDHDITISNLTVNGNCANVGSATACCHGIQFWNTVRCNVLNVICKNMRGENGSAQETFHIDSIRCQDFKVLDSLCTRDDGGNTASGFSSSFSDRCTFERNIATFMNHANGYTLYSSTSGSYVGCYAGGNLTVSPAGGTGFNNEQCSHLSYVNCFSGVEMAQSVGGTASNAYTNGFGMGNGAGFVTRNDMGGGEITYTGCHAKGNANRGFAVFGAITGTATTGTTASTIVASASIFSPAHIGRYVQLGTHGYFKITAVSVSVGMTATCTTESAHGGASGDVITIAPTNIEFIGGSIVDNPVNGFQSTETATAMKLLAIRGFSFRGTRIHGNGNDLILDTGQGSSTAVTRFGSNPVPSTITSNLASAAEFQSPFPCDMLAIVGGTPTANTFVRGSHPRSPLSDTGVTTGSFIIPRGGSIRVTATTPAVTWWTMW
jgi:hypothetical protein